MESYEVEINGKTYPGKWLHHSDRMKVLCVCIVTHLRSYTFNSQSNKKFEWALNWAV